MRRIRDRVPSLVLLFVVLAAALLAPVRAQISTETVFPGQTWEYVARENLEAYGWSPAVLQKATTYIRDESNTTGLVVVDRGRVVYRYGDIEELSYIAATAIWATAICGGSSMARASPEPSRARTPASAPSDSGSSSSRR